MIKILKFIKSLFKSKKKSEQIPFQSIKKPGDPKFPDEIENNPVMREAIMRCLDSNKPVFGVQKSDGSVSFVESDHE